MWLRDRKNPVSFDGKIRSGQGPLCRDRAKSRSLPPSSSSELCATSFGGVADITAVVSRAVVEALVDHRVSVTVDDRTVRQ